MNRPTLKDHWRNAMNDSLEADTRPMSTQVTDSSRHNTALKAQNTASQHCIVRDTKLSQCSPGAGLFDSCMLRKYFRDTKLKYKSS